MRKAKGVRKLVPVGKLVLHRFKKATLEKFANLRLGEFDHNRWRECTGICKEDPDDVDRTFNRSHYEHITVTEGLFEDNGV